MLNHRVPANARALPARCTSEILIEAARFVVIIACTVAFAMSAPTFADLLRVI